MAIRISGINSSLDTDSIVQELVKAQRTKVDTLKKAQTKLGWKQDAWKTLNTKINKLYNETLDKMKYQYAYSKKTTKVSNSDAVSVITGEKAVNGVQSLDVEQLAQSGFLTGGKISGNVTGSTKLGDLAGNSFPASGTSTISLTTGGKTTDITLTADTTLDEVAQQLQKAGVNANFDAKNQRFFVSSKAFGKDHDFSITASDSAANNLLSTLGLKASLKEDAATLAEYKKYAEYYVNGDEAATLANMKGLIDSSISQRVATHKTEYTNMLSSLGEAQKNLDKALTDPLYDAADTRTQEELEQAKKDLSDEIAALPDGDEKTAKSEEMKKLQQQLTCVTSINGYRDTISGLNDQKAMLDSYVDVTLDADGKVSAVTAKDKLTKEIEKKYQDKAENAYQVYQSYLAGGDNGGAHKTSGQDAQINLNGATFTSDTNVFEINGLTFTALKETKGEKVTVTTQDDTDGIYDMVRSFIKEYNTLINEMDKLYNAETAKGYEPLTDDEKEEMSDSEVEKWEDKIKDSILRRDSSLGSFSSELKNIMLAGVEVNGKSMYLSDFGINTLGYFSSADNEKNAYHIDGDADNAKTSSKDDVLKGMIANDPDTVMTFFSSLTRNMYDKMHDLMAGTEYRTISTAYDDKKMKEDYNAYTTKIKEQEKKVSALETKWYNKFTVMETALAKMQSNQSAVTSLLGGS